MLYIDVFWAETYMVLWAPPMSQSQGEHLYTEFPKPQNPGWPQNKKIVVI